MNRNGFLVVTLLGAATICGCQDDTGTSSASSCDPACAANEVCTEDGCVAPCIFALECAADEQCVDGTCVANPDADCHADTDCTSPNACERADGAACVGGVCRYPASSDDLCSGHGECIDDGGTAVCECWPGFTAVGLTCVPGDCGSWEGIAFGDPCDGVGACGTGVVVCATDGETATCSTNPDGPDSEATAEICDGEDNDCDASTDEELVAPAADRTDGVCVGLVKLCSGAGGWVEPDYVMVAGYEDPETSCDGDDNDCDGTADNGLVAPPASRTDGICDGLVQVCGGEAGWEDPDYTALPDFEDPEATCDGLDNDCNGEEDEGTCPSPSICCGGSCLDVSTDPDNCGACGRTCCSGIPCDNGVCYLFDGCSERPEPGCDGCACELDVCSDWPHCCDSMWDLMCVDACTFAGYCTGGGTPTYLCGTTCVDLEWDLAHCGACDRACATGETCIAGQCFAVVANGQQGIMDVVTDADTVYWVVRGLGGSVMEVRSAPKAGGGWSLVTDQSGREPNTLLHENGVLYWTTRGNGTTGEVDRLDLSGGSLSRLAIDQPYIEELCLDAGTVYFGSYSDVRSVPKTGGTVGTVSTEGYYRLLACDGAFLYFGIASDGAELHRLDPVTGGRDLLASGQSMTGIAADGTYVYWRNGSDGSIQRMDTDGGIITLATGPTAAHYRAHIDVDDTYVYWSTANAIWRVPREGGTVVAVISGVPEIRRFTVDATHVYWAFTDTDFEVLLRAPLP